MRDPYLTLGIDTDADDEAVHAAYLRLIRAYPPERDSQRFQQIRQAYEALETRKQRLGYELFDTEAPELHELLDAALGCGTTQRPDVDLLRRCIRQSAATTPAPLPTTDG